MTVPIVSVIIPTYNRCRSLEVTLEGLRHQDFDGPWEVLVISDGCTDETSGVVREIAMRASYPLRFMDQVNAGPARARNRGIFAARGEIILFLDDDVEPAPNLISRHVQRHQNVSDVAVIGTMVPDPHRQRSEPVWIAWEHAMLEKQYTAFRTGEWSGAEAHHFYSGNASVRRAHLVAVGGFNETFGRQEDVELAVRLEQQQNIRFRFDPEAVGIHRPLRTFNSWLKVPFAYGSLDVTRAQADGGRTWERVLHGYHARNRGTRSLADLCLSCPAISPAVRTLLVAVAIVFYALRQPAVALSALSALYNVRYLEGAASALDSPRLLQTILHKQHIEAEMPVLGNAQRVKVS